MFLQRCIIYSIASTTSASNDERLEHELEWDTGTNVVDFCVELRKQGVEGWDPMSTVVNSNCYESSVCVCTRMAVSGRARRASGSVCVSLVK